MLCNSAQECPVEFRNIEYLDHIIVLPNPLSFIWYRSSPNATQRFCPNTTEPPCLAKTSRVYQIWCKQRNSSHNDCASAWDTKFSRIIVRWDRALVATRGQRLVGQKYSGEHKRCIRCATFPLNCYFVIMYSDCWTIRHKAYMSLVPRQNSAVCVHAFSYKAHIVFRYCWRWSINRSSSFWMSTRLRF